MPRFDGVAGEYRVVEHGPNDIVGVGRPGEKPVPLTGRDITVYRMAPRSLAGVVAEALGIAPDFAPVEGVPNTYQLGLYRLLAGFDFPTFLTVQLEPTEYRSAAESLLCRQAGGALLLAPTRRHHGVAMSQLLNQRNGTFLSLDESIRRGESGRWQLTETAEHILTEHRSKLVPAPDEQPRMFFPTPADALWSDVRIRFLDGDRVSVRVGEVRMDLNYTQMGMADGRNAKCTKQWELLRTFSRCQGRVTWSSRGADRKLQKQCETLVADLKSFFRITGEPITLTDDRKGWQTVFAIEPD